MTKDDPSEAIQRHARDIDQLLGYLKHETSLHLAASQKNPNDWGYAGDLGYIREQLLNTAAAISGKESESIDDLIAQHAFDPIQIETPDHRPPDYGQPEMHSDLLELHQNIGERIRDGYSYLIKQDYDMAGTLFNDVGDLLEVSDLIQKGDYGRARTHLANLDTAVRDEIPSRLYESIYRA